MPLMVAKPQIGRAVANCEWYPASTLRTARVARDQFEAAALNRNSWPMSWAGSAFGFGSNL
jgi:hypothetical protein